MADCSDPRDKALMAPAKPCPFCGSSFLFFDNGAVCCDECQAEGPFVGQFVEPSAPLKQEAVKLWNRRSRG